MNYQYSPSDSTWNAFSGEFMVQKEDPRPSFDTNGNSTANESNGITTLAALDDVHFDSSIDTRMVNITLNNSNQAHTATQYSVSQHQQMSNFYYNVPSTFTLDCSYNFKILPYKNSGPLLTYPVIYNMYYPTNIPNYQLIIMDPEPPPLTSTYQENERTNYQSSLNNDMINTSTNPTSNRKPLKSCMDKKRMSTSSNTKKKCFCEYTKCNATFSRNSERNRHHKTVHEGKRYTCNFCGKGFTRKYNLKEHQNVNYSK